jgi:peptidyl-dipeptidase Dcp
MSTSNPFANRSTLEYELPPFSQIKEEHYLPAFYEGCKQQLAEVQAILDTPGLQHLKTQLSLLKKAGKC